MSKHNILSPPKSLLNVMNYHLAPFDTNYEITKETAMEVEPEIQTLDSKKIKNKSGFGHLGVTRNDETERI